MRRLLARLDGLPIRWRLAVTSAALTAAILALFALVFGVLVTRQLRTEFDENLRDTARDLQGQLEPSPNLELRTGRELRDRIVAGNAAIRVVTPDGRVLGQTPDAPNLGRPSDEIREVNGYRVASRPLAGQLFPQVVGYIQYGEPDSRLDSNIARVRLLLLLGVLGGSGLALLAGVAVARRAMAPIAALTRAAKGVARTRDPAVRLPKPVADDEVADLARTLEEMLMALDQARAETHSTLERQREFVADASHELRTPLTSVLANLELLEAELATGGDAAEMASSALRSTRRMRRLVADLLLLARADAGRRAPRRQTDLGEAARAAAAEVAPLATGHELELDAPAGVTVDGVPDDLHRLVLNLLENAVRHTPPGTPVRLAVRRDGADALLVVEDEGPGIPPEQGERVFERFVRGAGDGAGGAPPAGDSLGAGGSGLGLALVRAVAESHGGGVALEERDGGGARFTVRLPAAGAHARGAEPGVEQPPVAG